MKTVVYVLCHSADAYAAAQETFADVPETVLVRIPSSMWMENIAYTHVLQHRKHEWIDADYVGFVSPTLPSKMGRPLNLNVPRGADVIPLWTDVYRKYGSLVAAATAAHPRFTEVWVPLLRELGFSEEEALSPHVVPFYAQAFLARPAVMLRYMDFFATARRALETLPEIQDALWSDAGYAGGMTPEELETCFGVPYYPHLPFVCERLPCIVFTKWKVVVAVAMRRKV